MAAIHEALAAVMVDVDHVAKRDRNTHQKFLFRGIDAVVNAVGPALRAHGVVVVPEVETVSYDSMPTSSRPATACRVVVTYRFYAPDGSELVTRVAAEAWDMGDKATPKAMSVAFRTALLQALALPTDEPDPDSASYERAKPSGEQPPVAPPTPIRRRKPTLPNVRTELATPEHPAPDGSVDVPLLDTVTPPADPPTPSAARDAAAVAAGDDMARRALFARLGKIVGTSVGREERLAICAAILDIPKLDSSKDMSRDDVNRVLTFLDHVAQGEAGWNYDSATGTAKAWRKPPPEPPDETHVGDPFYEPRGRS